MYSSALLAMIFGGVSTTPYSSFTVSEGLFNGLALSSGSTAMNAFGNATGGMTVDLGVGEGTATITDNIYNSQTITFSQSAMDPIVGRPSLFGDSFTQGGTPYSSIEPSFMGDGLNVMMNDGPTYVGMTDVFSSVSFNANSMMDFGSMAPPSYLNNFSSVGSFADTTSALDVFDAATAVDGIDIMGFL